MTVKDVHQWHLKYHCRLASQNEFQEMGCSNKCHLFCGNHNMKPFYKTDVIYPNYLSDPLAEGFKIQFYRDAETSIPASIYGYRDIYCKFKNGTYPALQSWKLVLKDGEPSYRSSDKVFKNDSKQTITIYLPQGLELYAKLVTFYDRNRDDVVVNKLINLSRNYKAGRWAGTFRSALRSQKVN